MSVKRLAIAGLGTVGCGLINMIQAQRPEGIEIVAVSARDRNAQREADISAYEWCDDPLEFVSRDDIDCVVEMIGSSEGVARTLVTNSIKAGKPVITANKALIADHGAELAHIVDEHDVFFGYEAAVAGGIPIIKSLREAFVGNDIKSISGILNGTSNFILSTMAHTGRDFADVLQEAQDLGYAEADPSFDIEGIDAAHKLAIMAGIAFKQLIDFKAVKVRGITEISTQDVQYARQTGHRVKLLGLATQMNDKKGSALSLSVEPCFVHKSHPIAHVDGALNAVTVVSEPLGMSMLVGSGAGAGPTASSVYADVMDMLQDNKRPLYNAPFEKLESACDDLNYQAVAPYYLRLKVRDEIGVVAEISSLLAKHDLSMNELKQDSKIKGDLVDLYIILHDVRASDLSAAIEDIAQSENVMDPPLVLKIVQG